MSQLSCMIIQPELLSILFCVSMTVVPSWNDTNVKESDTLTIHGMVTSLT